MKNHFVPVHAEPPSYPPCLDEISESIADSAMRLESKYSKKGSLGELNEPVRQQIVEMAEGLLRRHGRGEQVRPEDVAIGIAVKHPELGVSEIAKRVNRNRGTLYKWKLFMKVFRTMRELSKADMRERTPRGIKVVTKDESTLEAWPNRDENDPQDEE